MSAASAAGPDGETRHILRRYFLAMGVPFGIDLLTSIVYAAINARPLILLPWVLVSSAFLLVGVGLGALALSRPLRRYLAGRVDFPAIERDVANLPRRSATVVACLYAPMLAVRLLSPRAGITFGAEIEISAWVDTVCSFLVVTSFNFVLTYFVVSAYLDRLCNFLFAAHGINIAVFDAMGKTLNLPIHDLLGGRNPRKLACYATTGYFTDNPKAGIAAQLSALPKDMFAGGNETIHRELLALVKGANKG